MRGLDFSLISLFAQQMPRKPNLVVLHHHTPSNKVWTPRFCLTLAEHYSFTSYSETASWNEEQKVAVIREAEILLTSWSSTPVPKCLAENPGNLKYICHINGEIRKLIDRAFIERGFVVSNWGSAPGSGVAEGGVALLLASLKCIPEHVMEKHGDQWALSRREWIGSITQMRLGIMGMGAVGRDLVRLLKPFQGELFGFDPYASDWPEEVNRANSLDELFATVDAIILAAGLNEETRHAVNAARLALLPDGGIVVNVGRGGLVDQEALLAEVQAGRLRAALDVLDTNGEDWLPPGHPARKLKHLILTAHSVATSDWNRTLPGREDAFVPYQEICLDNLQRYSRGESPRYTFDLTRYDRST